MLRLLAVTNMYPTQEAPELGSFVEQQIKGLRQIGLNVDVMLVDRARRGMRVYLSLGRKVRARAAEFQADVVHVMYGGVIADEVTRNVRDRPTIVSFCGSDLLGENLSGSLRKLISRYGVLASHRSAKQASGIVVKSKNLRDALPSDTTLSKVRVIPNGLDLELFKPLNRRACRDRLGWSNNGFHVLFATNGADPCKRPELARAALIEMRKSGISAEIHELRKVPHDLVPVWLNAADVLLLTSLHEGSPNTVKEALACNVPVVSVDVGDVRERIEGIEGCFLASPDPGDLAAKLCLVHDRQSRVAGRIKMQDLSLEHVARRLATFYEDVVLSYGRTK